MYLTLSEALVTDTYKLIISYPKMLFGCKRCIWIKDEKTKKGC
jgi:hypothetical protein